VHACVRAILYQDATCHLPHSVVPVGSVWGPRPGDPAALSLCWDPLLGPSSGNRRGTFHAYNLDAQYCTSIQCATSDPFVARCSSPSSRNLLVTTTGTYSISSAESLEKYFSATLRRFSKSTNEELHLLRVRRRYRRI
jgi:hypothetical protein